MRQKITYLFPNKHQNLRNAILTNHNCQRLKHLVPYSSHLVSSMLWHSWPSWQPVHRHSHLGSKLGTCKHKGEYIYMDIIDISCDQLWSWVSYVFIWGERGGFGLGWFIFFRQQNQKSFCLKTWGINLKLRLAQS